MFKVLLPVIALATLVAPVQAMPHQSNPPLARPAPSGWLQIRDVQSARNGGGNGCWNACFTDFDACMGLRTKTQCVSRVKTCLETCDRLSHRPGM
jgi:hypothetical protein